LPLANVFQFENAVEQIASEPNGALIVFAGRLLWPIAI
jgi:hypothetical protein